MATVPTQSADRTRPAADRSRHRTRRAAAGRSRVVIVGAGLGGLACGLRLQRLGFEVTVLEQGRGPGGRAGQITDAGFTWDTGPSLITMPWVLEQTFAAGGLDLHREIDLHRLDPLYRIRWAQEDRPFDFRDSPEALAEEVARFSERDARRVPDFLEALRPIYEQGILAAGQRPVQDVGTFLSLLPMMSKLRAAGPLNRFVARYFEHERVREAMSFHSLFIGGDPFRVPAIYGALVYLQVTEGGWYAEGGVYSLVRAMARPLNVRYGSQVTRVDVSGGSVRGVRLADGSRLEADVVISNGDVLATDELLGRRRSVRSLVPTMSCFLLYLGLDRVQPELRHHTLLVGPRYREFIEAVTRGRSLPQTLATYVHAPTRTEAAMAPPPAASRSRFCCRCPTSPPTSTGPRPPTSCASGSSTTSRPTTGCAGSRHRSWSSTRRTPEDFRDRFGAVLGNAFAIEPTLHQSALLRPSNRDTRTAGLYRVGAGTHPRRRDPGRAARRGGHGRVGRFRRGASVRHHGSDDAAPAGGRADGAAGLVVHGSQPPAAAGGPRRRRDPLCGVPRSRRPRRRPSPRGGAAGRRGRGLGGRCPR